MKTKFFNALSLAVIFSLLITSLALADNIINDVAVNVTDTINAGGFTTVGYKINFATAANPQDSQAGCNASDGTPLTLTLSVPVGVTATSSDSTWNATNKSLTFSACSVFKYVVLSSNSAGNYPISVNPSDSGTGAYQNQANFTLHVLAPPVTNTPPTLTLPADMTVEGNTTGGANVSYSATANDNEDGPLTPSCNPASGSFFALGTTTVNCSVTDSGSLPASGSFTVTVVDTTAPSLSLPANQQYEGNTTGGYNGAYTGATASDIVDASPTVICAPVSGSLFGLGANTISCTATDASTNFSNGSFTVTVVDTTKPSITCPANISGTVGQVVNLGTPTVSDIVDANPTVGNNAPGSFGPGTTTVNWTAIDASSNSAACSQTVTLTYVWLGFFQPVDNLPTVNKAKAGQGIPFKWALKDANGNFVSDLSTVSSYGYGSLACGGGTTDTIESYDTTGASGLRYDFDANQFIFTSKTDKAWAGSCKTFTVYLNDGTKHQANFNFVK